MFSELLVKIGGWLTNFGKSLKKEPEKMLYPSWDYAIIKLTDIGKRGNALDDFNKNIYLFSDGKVKDMPYSERDVEALEEMGVIVTEENSKPTNFEFEEEKIFGEVEN